MKTVKLSQQYFINMMIFFLMMFSFIVSRSSIIPQEYKSTFMWIYSIVLILIVVSGLFNQEKVDESAEKALNKVNRIIWNIVLNGLLLLAVIVGSPKFQKDIYITRDNICLVILLFLFLITFLKYILFLYYDKKGL